MLLTPSVFCDSSVGTIFIWMILRKLLKLTKQKEMKRCNGICHLDTTSLYLSYSNARRHRKSCLLSLTNKLLWVKKVTNNFYEHALFWGNGLSVWGISVFECYHSSWCRWNLCHPGLWCSRAANFSLITALCLPVFVALEAEQWRRSWRTAKWLTLIQLVVVSSCWPIWN